MILTRIYLITNLVNGKQYVGKTKYTLAHRFSQHCNNDYYKTYLHNAIKKYGKENFKIEEICTCNDNHWQELETFYIKFYHTHYTEGGYNITFGGDTNPMDDDAVRLKHKQIMSTPERRKLDSEIMKKYRNSELGRQHDKETSKRQRGKYLKQFQQWNESRKCPVAMIDEDGNEIMRFESASEACDYVYKTEGRKIDKSYTSKFKKYADKFNKNGKRAKFLGHAWKIL